MTPTLKKHLVAIRDFPVNGNSEPDAMGNTIDRMQEIAREAVGDFDRGMSGEDHIVAWAESSRPHYERLLRIATPGNFRSNVNRANACLMLAVNVYQAACKSGDMFARDHDAGSILRAAVMISEWKEPI